MKLRLLSIAGLAALTGALAVAGCGSDDDSGGGTSGSAGKSGGAGGKSGGSGTAGKGGGSAGKGGSGTAGSEPMAGSGGEPEGGTGGATAGSNSGGKGGSTAGSGGKGGSGGSTAGSGGKGGSGGSTAGAGGSGGKGGAGGSTAGSGGSTAGAGGSTAGAGGSTAGSGGSTAGAGGSTAGAGGSTAGAGGSTAGAGGSTAGAGGSTAGAGGTGGGCTATYATTVTGATAALLYNFDGVTTVPSGWSAAPGYGTTDLAGANAPTATISATEGKFCPGALKGTYPFTAYNLLNNSQTQESGTLGFAPSAALNWTGKSKLHLWEKVDITNGVTHLSFVQLYVANANGANFKSAQVAGGVFADGSWHEIVFDLAAASTAATNPLNLGAIATYGLQVALKTAATAPTGTPPTTIVYVDDVWVE